MVAVPVAVPKVPFTGAVRFSVKVSVASIATSFTIATVTVLTVSPAAKVTVPSVLA